MADSGVTQMRDLSVRLKAAGSEGRGLRRAMDKSIREAAKPVTETIADPAYLRPYMPDRYADVLAADLSVKTSVRGGGNPGVTIRARGALHKGRQVRFLNRGFLRHPVYARPGTPRSEWRWSTQTGGMKPGFFSDACKAAGPEIRDKVLGAIHETAQKIAGRP